MLLVQYQEGKFSKFHFSKADENSEGINVHQVWDQPEKSPIPFWTSEITTVEQTLEYSL